MTTRVCDWCKQGFQARTADVERGWARFCSKSCKAKEQEKRTGRNRAHLERRPSASLHDMNQEMHDAAMSAMSDMDFGASDGGGYERYP